MKTKQVAAFATGAETHVGAVRRQNEDAFAVREDLGLWIVADGMGGAAAGDVASMLAVSTIQARFAAGGDLVSATRGAHDAILSAPAEGRGKAGMGATVVALTIGNGGYEIVWVGDSRAYLLRDGVLSELTHDHSLVQDMVDRGEITAEEARQHPQRNVITQALGGLGIAAPVPDRVNGDLRPGDVFLLCTDGLNGELGSQQIELLVKHAKGPHDAARKLVEAALKAGGRDNVTAVVIARL